MSADTLHCTDGLLVVEPAGKGWRRCRGGGSEVLPLRLMTFCWSAHSGGHVIEVAVIQGSQARLVTRTLLRSSGRYRLDEGFALCRADAVVRCRFRGPGGARLLQRRGGLVVRKLAARLGGRAVLSMLSSILEDEQDLPFAAALVQALNLILLTAPEVRTDAVGDNDIRRFDLSPEGVLTLPSCS